MSEYALLVMAYFSFLFTEFVPNGITRYNIGSIETIFLILFITYQVLYIAATTLRSAYIALRRCYYKRKYPERMNSSKVENSAISES